MRKSSMKNKKQHKRAVAAAGTDSNTKFKWSDDPLEDLLKPLSNLRQ